MQSWLNHFPAGVARVYLQREVGAGSAVPGGAPPSWSQAVATFVVMPDPQFAEVAQAQHVRKVEGVRVIPLKLVPVG